MPRLKTLALSALLLSSPIAAQAPSALNQVTTHLKAVDTMTADFTQTDRNGQSLTGQLTMKRPGKVRFQYQKGVPLLIVGDGKALTMIDYEVRQVSRWPIGNSPLSVLLDPNKNLDGVANVTRNDDQVLMIQARDPKKPEFGTISIAFVKMAGAPGGLMLRGWTMLDAQNNRTTVRLDNQRFNVAVADSSFRWRDPRPSGPRG